MEDLCNCPKCAGHGSYRRDKSCSAVDYYETPTWQKCNFCRGTGKVTEAALSEWRENRKV